MVKNYVCIFLLSLVFSGCAGYEMPDIKYENFESGVKVETTKEGKICLDDGKVQAGCIQLNKKEEVVPDGKKERK